MAQYLDAESGITLDNEFECASAREFSRIGPGHYEVQLLIENYNPAYPVVWEYMFCFRVRSQSDQAQTVTFRVMKARGGISYLDGPHFTRRNGNWELVPRSQTQMSNEYVEVTLDVAPGDEFLLGNHPFPTPGEVESTMHATAAALDNFSVREYGRTPEDRPAAGAGERTPRPNRHRLHHHAAGRAGRRAHSLPRSLAQQWFCRIGEIAGRVSILPDAHDKSGRGRSRSFRDECCRGGAALPLRGCRVRQARAPPKPPSFGSITLRRNPLCSSSFTSTTSCTPRISS